MRARSFPSDGGNIHLRENVVQVIGFGVRYTIEPLLCDDVAIGALLSLARLILLSLTRPSFLSTP